MIRILLAGVLVAAGAWLAVTRARRYGHPGVQPKRRA